MRILDFLNSAGNSGTFFYLFPIVAKINLKPDGFTVYGKWIPLNDIISIFYRDRSKYLYPFFPKSWTINYEVLTNKEVIYIFGLQNEFNKFLDKNLEIVSDYELDSRVGIGYIKRWKQIGQKYVSASPDDMITGQGERLNQISVSTRWIYLVLIITLLIILIFVTKNLIYPIFKFPTKFP